MIEFKKTISNQVTISSADLRSWHYYKRMTKLARKIAETRQIILDPMYAQLNRNSGLVEENVGRQDLKARVAHLRDIRDVFAAERHFLIGQKKWLFDQRNKRGTGPLIAISPYTGVGDIVYFSEWEAQTACPLRNFQLDGDEVSCAPGHAVVRRWKAGNIVSIPNQKNAACPERGISR